MRFEDVKYIAKRHVRSDVPQYDAILLKKPGLCCFFLSCKIDRGRALYGNRVRPRKQWKQYCHEWFEN